MSDSRPVRRLGGVVVILFLLFGVVVGGLHLPFVLNIVRDEVVQLTNESLQGTIEIEEISGSPFGELEIRGVSLKTAAGEPVVVLDRVRARVELSELPGLGVLVHGEASGTSVFLRRGADGELNLTDVLPAESDEPSTGLPVWLDLNIAVDEASVVWRDDTVSSTARDPLAAIGPTTTIAERREAASRVVVPEAPPRQPPHTVLADATSATVRVVVERNQRTIVRVGDVRTKLTATELGPARNVSVAELAIEVEPEGGQHFDVRELDIDEWVKLDSARVALPLELERLALQASGIELRGALFQRVAPEVQLQRDVDAELSFGPDGDSSRFTAKIVTKGHKPIELTGWVEADADMQWSLAMMAPALIVEELTSMEQPVKRLGMVARVDGKGAAPDTLNATVRAAAHSLDVDRYRVESAFVSGVFVDQKVRVDRAFVQTPYASVGTRFEFGLADGDFQVTARAEATDAVAELARQLFGRKITTRADVSIDATGNVDLDREDPVEMLRRLRGDVSWDINDFVAEDVQVRQSSGDVKATLDTEGGLASFDLDGRVSGRSLRGADSSLGSMSADFRASSRVKAADPAPMDILRGLKARVDVDVNGLVSSGSLVRDLNVLVTVAPRGAQLRYDVRGSAARISAGTVRVQDAAARLDGQVTLGDTMVWPAALRAVSVRGNASARGVDASGDAATAINADINIAGPLSDLRGSVNASTTGLKVADYAFTSLAAKVKFVGGRIFEVDADGKQADRTPEDLGVYIRGRYNRDLTDYEILELRFTSAGDAWNLSEGFSFDTDGGDVRFDKVTLERGDQRINIDGTFRQGRDQDLKIDIDNVELAEVASDFGLVAMAPLRGKVSADAELGGTATEPTARFSVHLEGLYWADYGPFEIRAEGRYAELALVVESFEVDGYEVRLAEGNAELPIRLTTNGEFEVLQSRKIEVFLETPKFAPSELYAALPVLAEWSVGGKLSQTTTLRGTLLNPRLNTDVRTSELTATPRIDADALAIGPIESTLAVRYSDPGKQNGGFEVSLNAAWSKEPPVQVLARVQADVAAWVREWLDGAEIPWEQRLGDAPWRFVGSAKKFDLRNVRIGKMREADMEGFVTLNVIGDGTLSAPRANFEIDLDEFGWDRYRDVFVDADLAVENDHLLLKSSRLEWDGDEILTADGRVPVPFQTFFGDAPLGEMPMDFRVKLTPTNLAKLSAVDYSFAALQGKASGFVSLGGTLTKPVIETHLAADGVQFADRSTGSITIDASVLASGEANGRIQWQREEKPTLRATASLPLDLNFVRLAAGEEFDLSGPLSAEITGAEVPLASLIPRRIFDSYVKDIAGRLDASAKIAGTVEKPTFDGRLRLSNAKLTLSEYERTFTNVQFDATADPSGKLSLHKLRIEGEQGHVEAQGTLAHDGWQPGVIDGKAEVREFGTTGFTDLAIFLTADAALGGDFAAKPATATATISGVEVVMPDTTDQNAHPTSLDEDIVVIRSDKDRELLFAVEGSLEPVSTDPFLELAIRIERGARVRHPLAQVELEGDLDLALSEAGPTLVGEVNAYRGRARVLDKEFTIQQGLVTFTGSDPPDPRLQIEAAHALDERVTSELGQPTSGEPRAIVRVTGRSSDPQIRFRSDPGMPESDVIYVLMTGRLPGQGGVGETGIAAGAASGLLTNLIAESPVGRVVDVRVEAGEEGLSDASIEVGRYIGRDVFIALDIKSSPEPDENASELNIEYRFAPRWIFEFKAGDRATGEANIFWDIL